MNILEELSFEPMLITEVFEVVGASQAWYDKSKLKTGGPAIYPFVSRTRASNGIGSFCAEQDKKPNRGNAITIGLDTQTIAYQPVAFYTGQNIQVLRHERLDENNALVLCTIIGQQMGRFSWGGNGVTLGRLTRTRIMVPVTTDDHGKRTADWEGMTTLGLELRGTADSRARLVRQTTGTDSATLPDLTFSPVFITDIFESMKPAKGWMDFVRVKQSGPVAHPYVSRSGGANSIGAFIPHQGFDPPNRGNVITIGVSTSTVFYQPVPFYTGKEIQVLTHKRMTQHSGQLLVTIIREQMSKFKWGNGASIDRLKATRIMVPTTTGDDGDEVVDWEGMDRYGRALRVRAERFLDAADKTATRDEQET